MTDYPPALTDGVPQPTRAYLPVEVVYRVTVQMTGEQMAAVRYGRDQAIIMVRADELVDAP